MTNLRIALASALLAAPLLAHAGPAVTSTDPLVAIDLNRAAIIADIVESMHGNALVKSRLEALRADRLLAASLASSPAMLAAILDESLEASATLAGHVREKAFGDGNRDLLYTPLAPCRLLDTRGFGAPIVGGPFAPNERRAYVPNGLCAIPASGVAAMLISFTTQNLTPGSGGYLAILAPAAPVQTSVDVFNLGAQWSASNTSMATGPAGQFDVYVNAANAHVVIDVLGYFTSPLAGGVGTASLADAAVTNPKLADGSVTAAKLGASGCSSGQVLQFNGSAWACATPASGGGGTVTSVLTGSGLAGGPITASGTISLAGTQLLPSVACGSGQVPGWSGTAWACTTPGNVGGANTTLGFSAMAAPGGSSNTAIGASAMPNMTVGSFNTAVGANALQNANTGNGTGHNTAVGFRALNSVTNLPSNTALGSNAGYSITGTGNTALGAGALYNNATGHRNIAVGSDAGQLLTTGSDNIAIGHQGAAAESNTIRIGAAQNRTFMAGIRGVTPGAASIMPVLIDSNGQLGTGSTSNSTFLGSLAGNLTLTGPNNTGVGANALKAIDTGDANSAFGSGALPAATAGNSNTAIGVNALAATVLGARNTAVGRDAGASADSRDNTVVGAYSLVSNTSGFENAGLGVDALHMNTTGVRNTAVGYRAGYNLTTGGLNIMIGNEGVAGEASTIRIGTTQARAFVAGIRGTTTGAANGIAVLVDSNGQLGTISSSARVKDDIADMGRASAALMKLRPVTFHYKEYGPESRLQYGLIAEEVDAVYPEMVAKRPDGSAETVMYHFLPPMLLNEFQRQQRTIERQGRELEELRQAVAALRANR
jgi:hypothetical protein